MASVVILLHGPGEDTEASQILHLPGLRRVTSRNPNPLKLHLLELPALECFGFKSVQENQMFTSDWIPSKYLNF